jgi:hypothetical protein
MIKNVKIDPWVNDMKSYKMLYFLVSVSIFFHQNKLTNICLFIHHTEFKVSFQVNFRSFDLFYFFCQFHNLFFQYCKLKLNN